MLKNLEKKGNPWGLAKKQCLKWTEEVDFKVPVGAFLGSYKIFVAVDRPRAVVGVVLESATGVGNEDDALA
jgi:hypothetical protein